MTGTAFDTYNHYQYLFLNYFIISLIIQFYRIAILNCITLSMFSCKCVCVCPCLGLINIRSTQFVSFSCFVSFSARIFHPPPLKFKLGLLLGSIILCNVN